MRFLVLVALVCFGGVAAELKEIFAWKEVSFNWPSEDVKNNALKAMEYIPEHNLPLGLERWKNKLFVTVPRWKSGVASSLNYIPINSTDKSPALTPYPDWKANTLPKEGETLQDNHVISTFRVKVDPCDRLWVMDTGLADIKGDAKLHSSPAIVVFDLKTDQLVRRYVLKESDSKGDSSFFANIVVDVTKDTCDKAFAYLPDLGGYGLVVYSFADNKSWRISNNYFHFDPLKGDLTVGGVNFQWTDGIFGLALGPINQNGYRTAYFHALASTEEFSVSTEVLRNETLAMDHNSFELYKHEGNKGEKSQTSTSVFDQKTNVLFFTQLQRDAVACWNTKKKLEPGNVALVAEDHTNLVFTNDISIDVERNLWILSDRMPAFLYTKLDPNDVNYRILQIPVDEAIKETTCAV
ncbi:unnamed protein product [Phaedon cochleariae]|uniref:Yellow-c n=1 Tax=Phaedon cochleariae TaxID=80249 RepID=A0A9P0DSD1_PHACE|nr:unnamed protein product [Phaedon cochleariae]